MVRARVVLATQGVSVVISATVSLVKRAFDIFSKERAGSRGAAIAFYTVTSMAPILVIVVAVAGLVFGEEAASGAIREQFSGLLGVQAADLLQTAIASASNTSGGITATIISVVTLLLGASGVFLELQDALNAMWQAKAREGLAGMARARLASLGLVISLGFLLIVSLVVDAALNAFGGFLPFGAPLLMILSIVVSVVLLTGLFAGIFKFLPATAVAWRDVKFGAIVTALLFEAGKSVIGMYLGSSAAVTSLGAAGALLALLFWVYYSSQIFLFGAAITKAHAEASRPSGVAQTLKPGLVSPAVSSPRRRKEATSSVLSLAVLLLARAIAVVIVERWRRKTPVASSPKSDAVL
jgi:membrane protein